MATEDQCCTIVPYFKVHAGHVDAFRALCQQFVEKTSEEPKCPRLEVHGPEQELAKLREPLAELNPVFFVLEYGFRR